MESEWILPTWEINGDRICSGKSLCFLQTSAFPVALEQLSVKVICCKTLETDPCTCRSLRWCPVLFSWSWRSLYSPLPSGHGHCPTAEPSVAPTSPRQASKTKKYNWKDSAQKIRYQNQRSPCGGEFQLLMYQGLRTVWWHPQLVIFSLFFLFH